jgi:hypothetical protein
MEYNVYKLSKRDDIKYLTCNGIEIASSITTDPPINWGWYGKGTRYLSYLILLNEYGENTAKQYSQWFVYNFLMDVSEKGTVFTSSIVELTLKQIDSKTAEFFPSRNITQYYGSKCHRRK